MQRRHAVPCQGSFVTKLSFPPISASVSAVVPSNGSHKIAPVEQVPGSGPEPPTGARPPVPALSPEPTRPPAAGSGAPADDDCSVETPPVLVAGRPAPASRTPRDSRSIGSYPTRQQIATLATPVAARSLRASTRQHYHASCTTRAAHRAYSACPFRNAQAASRGRCQDQSRRASHVVMYCKVHFCRRPPSAGRTRRSSVAAGPPAAATTATNHVFSATNS